MGMDSQNEMEKSMLSPEAQAIIRPLLAEIAELKTRIAKLESRLGLNPQNSSLPPSSQHPVDLSRRC